MNIKSMTKEVEQWGAELLSLDAFRIVCILLTFDLALDATKWSLKSLPL